MAARIDGDGGVPPNQLVVSNATEAYARSGRFSAEQMITFLGDHARTATRSGYRFTRAVGEMSWVLDSPSIIGDVMHYESELNRFAPLYRQALVCMYDLGQFGGGILVDLLRTHRIVLLGGMLLENPHYMSPDEFRSSRT